MDDTDMYFLNETSYSMSYYIIFKNYIINYAPIVIQIVIKHIIQYLLRADQNFALQVEIFSSLCY